MLRSSPASPGTTPWHKGVVSGAKGSPGTDPARCTPGAVLSLAGAAGQPVGLDQQLVELRGIDELEPQQHQQR